MIMQDSIKKANQFQEFTQWQLDELQKCAEDIFYFIENYVYVVHPVRGHILFEMHDYQRVMITNFMNYKDNVLLCSRQLGKSTCVNVWVLWYLCFHGQKTALLVGNILTAAIENMDRIKYSYEYLPDWLKPGIEIYNRTSVHFDNKSKLVARATTKNSGRGLSPSVVFCDELSFVDAKKQREFWSAISPTLSTGGKCIIASTPNNDEDLFAQICRGAQDVFDEHGLERASGIGNNGFKFTRFIWHANPERDAAWERQERAKNGDEFFLREHCCEFISFDATLIGAMTLARLQGRDAAWVSQDRVRWYESPRAHASYLVALDPAMGLGDGDDAAIQVFELPGMVQIAEWQHNKTDMPMQVRILRDITRYIDACQQQQDPTHQGEIYWTVENNTLGEACNIQIREMGEDAFAGMYLSATAMPKRKGYNMSSSMKIEACARFKNLVERDKIVLKSKPLIKQLKTFVRSGTGFAAKSGEHDDLVTPVLIAVKMLERIMAWQDDVMQEFSDHDLTDARMPMGIVVSSTSSYVYS